MDLEPAEMAPEAARPRWAETAAAGLRKVPWSVIGAFLVGLFAGAESMVGAIYSIGEKVGIVERPEQQEARKKFSRDLIVLIGTRSYRARQVLVAYALGYTQATKDATDASYKEITTQWNDNRLLNEVMLGAFYDQARVKEFDDVIVEGFGKMHRCLLQATGKPTSLQGSQCPDKTEVDKTDLAVALSELNKLDQKLRDFASSILPTQ